MARLPTVGGDSGNWGTVLNEYLSVEHSATGTHTAATDSASGVVELATQTETNTGSDTGRVVTPATLQGKIFSTQTLTDAASIAWDLSLGAFATVTLTDNRTLANPTNLVNGASYILIVKQDGTGSRTLAFDTKYKFPDGTDPTLSTGASAIDVLTFLCDGTNLYGCFQGNFS